MAERRTHTVIAQDEDPSLAELRAALATDATSASCHHAAHRGGRARPLPRHSQPLERDPYLTFSGGRGP